MSRPLKIALWSMVALVATLALCVVVLVQFDWNRAKPWLSARVTEATDRSFSMQGELALAWHRSDSPASGWRGWVPWPHMSAHEVVPNFI